MSGSARGVRPTDLLALVSFDGRVFRDEAITWDRLCRAHEPPSAFESALEGMLSFATGRHTWISVDGQRIRALVAGRKRGGPLVWEVDTLLATDEQPLVASGLLRQLARAAKAAGAVRVVLRLAADSSALPIAEAAGFAVYRRERRYVRGGAPLAVDGPSAEGVRPRRDADSLALFGLYNSTVSQAVRIHEAATLAEWRALRERNGARDHRELVLEGGDGTLSAWLRVARDGGHVRLMPVLFDPECGTPAGTLVHAALRPYISRRQTDSIVALVPEDMPGFGPALEALGFEMECDYVVLARKLAQTEELAVRRRAFSRAARTAAIPAGQALAVAAEKGHS